MFSTGRHAGHTLGVTGLLAALLLAFPTGSGAASDRKPPTTPTNLRVTGMTASSVSLAWNPSTDNSGSFGYRVQRSGGLEIRVPQTQTTFTWTGGIDPLTTYSFSVFAIDGAGNRSKNSNIVTVTTPADTIPPSTPVVSVRDVGPTHFSLIWSATDDGRFLWYTVFVNGATAINSTQQRSATISSLQPSTTYTVTVQASDAGGNRSALSAPVEVTTRPQDYVDTTPPTAPTNLWGSGHGDREFQLWWTESTDDVTPQDNLAYYVFINGVLSEAAFGQGYSPVNYGEFGSNTVQVYAVDGAGNWSEPGTITLILP